MFQDRLPPHDQDAEEAVIGSLLIDGSAINRIATVLNPPDFYYEGNQAMYQACVALYDADDAINQITVAQELGRRGKLESCGGVAHLSHLISICPTPLDIDNYADIVHRLAVMRRLINAAGQIAAIGYAADPDVDASLSQAEGLLYQLRRGRGPRDFVHIREVLDKYFETAAAAEGEAAGETSSYITTGFLSLDDILEGLHRSDLIIVAGRPSMGKTSLALNIARNVAVERKGSVAIFSLEMARESLVLRLLAGESGLRSKRLRFDHHSEEEERRIMDAIGVLAEAPVYIDDSPLLRMVEMRSKSRRLYHECGGLDLIILDHLGLMQGDTRTENRVQEISFISRSLKALARELNVPVLAVSQLSRASERRESHVPQLSDLRDSGSIEQDADVVLFVYRDEYYYKEDEWQTRNPERKYPRGEADLIVAKHRNGATGQIKLRFRHELARFENFDSQEVISP
ncbi:MAG: replicative DNA helicase [Chloroflexi bacterium]|nr:replicative DNA helicase [Chloroflexota bacterium]